MEPTYTLGQLKFQAAVYLFAALMQSGVRKDYPSWWKGEETSAHWQAACEQLMKAEAAVKLEKKDEAKAALAQLGLRLAYIAAQAGLLTDDLLPAVARRVGEAPERPASTGDAPAYFGSD